MPPKKNPNVTLQAVGESLKALNIIIQPKKGGERAKKDQALSLENVTKAIDSLAGVVGDLFKYLEKEENVKEETVTKMRIHEDEVDAQKQRNLRGKFVISSSGSNPLVESEEELKAQDIKTLAHVQHLAKTKYDVEIPEGEVASCYYLKKGGIVLSLWNQGRGSAFQKLVYKIKNNEIIKDKNVYFNFMLTRRRSKLLYEVRKYRKDDKLISKFFTDENGEITMLMLDNKTKERITNVHEKNVEGKKVEGMITLNSKELKDLVSAS